MRYNDDMRVYFNRRLNQRAKQYIEVVIHTQNEEAYYRENKTRWGWFLAHDGRDRTKGMYGTLHLLKSRVRFDTIFHEIGHVMVDYVIEYNLNLKRADHNERFCIVADELTRNFWKSYLKTNPAPCPFCKSKLTPSKRDLRINGAGW